MDWRSPAAALKWLNRTRRRQSIESLEGMLLHNSTVGGDDSEHRFAAAVRRWAEKGRPHRAPGQRAWDDLRLRWRGHLVAVRQAANVDTADEVVRGALERQPGRIEDRGRANAVSPNGALAGQMRPNALLLDRPSGLLTPVYCLVFAAGLLTLLSQDGLLALNICTRPP